VVHVQSPVGIAVSLLAIITSFLEEVQPPCHPLLFQIGRDRLSWVTLNGPEPLSTMLPNPDQHAQLDPETGQLTWEWSILPECDYIDMP
jgi:hypothetical protein